MINFDVPNTPDAYTHRIGRTGRAETLGKAFTFVTGEDRLWVRDTERVLGSKIPRLVATGLADAPSIERASGDRPQARSGGGGDRNRSRSGARSGARPVVVPSPEAAPAPVRDADRAVDGPAPRARRPGFR